MLLTWGITDPLMGDFMWHQFVVGATGWAALGLALMKPEPHHSSVVFFTCRRRKDVRNTHKMADKNTNSLNIKDIQRNNPPFQIIQPCCWISFLTPEIPREETRTPFNLKNITYRHIQQSSCLWWREQGAGQFWSQHIPSASACCRDPEGQNCD